jgi:hypothetical protein
MFSARMIASNKMLLRYEVDLATKAVPVGSTSDTLGLVLCSINSVIPTCEMARVTLAGIKAVTAIAGATNVTALTAFLQKNGGNNVNIPSSGGCALAPSGGAVAVGTRDIELGEEAVAKIFLRHASSSVATSESLKLVLAATGAATVPGTTSGRVEVAVVVEFTDASFS